MDEVLLIELVLILITVNGCDHQPKSNQNNSFTMRETTIEKDCQKNSSVIPETWNMWDGFAKSSHKNGIHFITHNVMEFVRFLMNKSK